MDRGFPARFQKKGPRAERGVQREALALVEQQCEKYVREKMKPQLVAAAKQAVAGFKRQNGR